MKFSSRRFRNLGLLLFLSLSVLFLYTLNSHSYSNSNFPTGWALLILMLFLALYNLRKKLSFLPLGRSSMWLQLHIYIGLLTVVFFLSHIRFRIPNGQLEVALMSLFLLVSGSGVAGLLISRIYARRLTTRDEEIIYERIPFHRRNIKVQAEELVHQSVAKVTSTSIANFYVENLQSFFEGPRFFLHHVIESKRPLLALLSKIEANGRYLNDAEKEIMGEIKELAEAKFNLDYHYTIQLLLKGWLFIHIPATYALLILSVVHGILVYKYY